MDLGHDPDKWAVADVQRFFKEDAVHFVNSKSKFPPLGPFLQKLEENDVNGHVLLVDVDVGFLRNDCNILSLGMRSSVLDCIRQLRQLSAKAQSHNEGLSDTQQPASLLTTAISVSNATAEADSPSPSAMRRGEQTVEDEQGRKRRKLNLLEPVQQSELPIRQKNVQAPAYLSDRKLPVDELFFGEIKMGARLANAQSLTQDGVSSANADEEDNFQFYGIQKLNGDRHFVFKQMQYFLMKAEQVEAQRENRDALLWLPYRDGAQGAKTVRSAVLLKASEGTITVTRQKAFQDDTPSNAPTTDAATEWDFLIQKYNDESGSIAFGADGSDAGNSEELSPSLIAEIEEEEEEERLRKSQQQKILGKELVIEVIEAFIRDVATSWKDNHIDRYELKRARTVWRQMKRSKTYRAELLGTAAATIADLQRRLEKFKREFLREEWSSESALKEACRVLDATIEDIEDQRWKMSVWRRNKEPEHQGHARQSRGEIVGTRLSRDGVGVSEPQDLIHEEITSSSANDAERDVSVELFPGAGVMNDELCTRTGKADSPVLNSQELPDEEDVIMGEDTPDNLSANRKANVYPLPYGYTQPPPTPPMNPSTQEDPPSTSESLPSIREITSSLIRPKPEPVTPTRMSKRPSTTPINLISSDESANRKRNQKSRKTVNTSRLQQLANPDDATEIEVALWDYEQLAKEQKAKHILIKALYDAGPEFRRRASEIQRELYHRRFACQLAVAVQALREGREDADHSPSYIAPTMRQVARIAIAFWTRSSKSLSPGCEEQIAWQDVPHDVNQMELFVNVLVPILTKRESSLFIKRENVGPNSQHNPVLVSSDLEDNDTLQDTEQAALYRTPSPTSKKRRVKESEIAKATRNSALKRQSKYEKALESQRSQEAGSSDVARLAAMVEEEDPMSPGILINPAKPDDQTPVYIHPQNASTMKQHQIEGVRFIWREMTADNGEQGCLLAHTMGLGKTMQTITFLVAVTQAAQSADHDRSGLPASLKPKRVRKRKRYLRVLIVCPSSLLQNWKREINTWASGGLIGAVELVEASSWTMSGLQDWHDNGGVLIVGYAMLKSILKKGSCSDEVMEQRESLLLDSPEIVVADEAHHLKNESTAVSITASRFRTKSRIALTGTPMSNDVQEIFALISWISPGYLGDKSEFNSLYGKPIEQGTYKESTTYERRKSLKKLAVLREQIAPKVNRADITVLRGSLKSKVEYVITVPLTELQVDVYVRFLRALSGMTRDGLQSEKDGQEEVKVSQVEMFSWLALLGLLTAHPLCFKRKLLSPPPKKQPNKPTQNEGDVDNQPGDEHVFTLGFNEAIVNHIVAGISDNATPSISAKTHILLEIVRLSRQSGDKLLVFSSSIPTLDYLSELFDYQRIPYGRIDGSVQIARRGPLIENFNKGSLDVLLVSTRAGGQGLNIQGANRVIIFDFGFNPTWEEQAVGRAYRLGQRKHVYVYRFVAGGTFETNVYNKQLFKSSLAQRVVDSKNPARNAERTARDWLYEPKDLVQQDLAMWNGKDPQVLDIMISRQEIGEDLGIRAIHTMETLQEDAKDEPLTAAEKAEVMQELADSHTKKAFWKGRFGGPIPTQPSPKPATSTPQAGALNVDNTSGNAANAHPEAGGLPAP